MAEINFDDLIMIIKENPKYVKDCEKGVPAEQALYIRFHEKNKTIDVLNSITFSLKNGSELVIDSDKTGAVYGIEII